MKFQRIIDVIDKQDRHSRVDESFADVMGAIGGAIGSLISGLLQGLAAAVNQSSKDYNRSIHRWGNEFERSQRMKDREKEREEAELRRKGKLEKKDEDRKAKDEEANKHNEAVEFFVEKFNSDKADLVNFKKAMSDAYKSHVSGILEMLRRVDGEMTAGVAPTPEAVPHEAEAEKARDDLKDAIRIVAKDKPELINSLTSMERDYLLSLLKRSERDRDVDEERMVGVRKGIEAIEVLNRVGAR